MKPFDENWRRNKLLGRGAFGSVFEAINVDSGERFAVKEVLLCGSDAQNETRLCALEKEIAIMAQLQHPNVVKYLGTARTQEAFHIFVELAPSGSLQVWIRFRDPVPVTNWHQ